MQGRTKAKYNYMKRGGLVTVFLMITWILSVFKMIPLTGIVSANGIALFAFCYEFMVVLLLLSTYFIPEFVSKQVGFRLSRGQHKNVRQVLRASLLVAVILSLLLAVFFFFIADIYAESFLQIPYLAFPMKCMCAAIPFYALSNVCKGYFEGMGTMMPTCVAGLFEQFFALPLSLILAYRLTSYGQKVSDLLLNPNDAAVYGSAAISIAVVICSGLSLLFLMIVYSVYRQSSKSQVKRDTTREKDYLPDIMLHFMQSLFPNVCPALFLFADTWINQRLYVGSALDKGSMDHVLTSYGVYYGQYRALILIVVVILVTACHFLSPVITKLYAREAYHQLQMEIQTGMQKILLVGGMTSLMFTILSGVVSNLLFKSHAAAASKLLLFGSFAILAYALAVYSTAYVRGLEIPWLSAGAWLLCLLAQSVFTYLLLHKTGLDILALAIMNVVYPLLVFGVNFMLIRSRIFD